MKLSTKAIAAISDRKIILALALALGFTEQWMRRLLEINKDNGPLTTIKSLQVIKKETGLSETDILEGNGIEGLQI